MPSHPDRVRRNYESPSEKKITKPCFHQFVSSVAEDCIVCVNCGKKVTRVEVDYNNA